MKKIIRENLGAFEYISPLNTDLLFYIGNNPENPQYAPNPHESVRGKYEDWAYIIYSVPVSEIEIDLLQESIKPFENLDRSFVNVCFLVQAASEGRDGFDFSSIKETVFTVPSLYFENMEFVMSTEDSPDEGVAEEIPIVLTGDAAVFYMPGLLEDITEEAARQVDRSKIEVWMKELRRGVD